MPETPPCDICGLPSCDDPRVEAGRRQARSCFGSCEKEFGDIWFCAGHWLTTWTDEEREIVRSRRAAAKAEQIPPDVAALIAEARKYRPEAVVEKRRGMPFGSLLIWRSTGPSVAVDGALDETLGSPAFRECFDNFGWSIDRTEIAVALAEHRVWPRADAERMVANETPAPASADLQEPGVTSGPPRAAEDSGRSDPYKRTDGLTDAQIAALMLVSEQAARTVPPQPAPDRRDPADWDCWDGPELTVS